MASAKSSARLLSAPSLKTGAAHQLCRFHGRLRHRAVAPGPGPAPRTGPWTRSIVTPDQHRANRDGVTPPFMRGREIVRVGLLLPFSLRPQDAAGALQRC